MLKMPLFVMMALAATVALTGCSKPEEQVPEAGQAAQAAAEAKPKASVESDVVALPPPPMDSDVIASVGEAKLTWGELTAKVDEMVGLYAKMTGGAIPTAQLPQAKQEFRRQQVQMFIVDNVIAAAAKELGVAVDDAFRAKQIADLEKRQGQSFAEILKSFPLGEEEAKSMLEKQWLELKLLEEKVFPQVTVDPAEVQAEIEKQQVAAKLLDEEMAGYAKQLVEGTASFEDLVKANSMIKEAMPLPEDRLAQLGLTPEAQAQLKSVPDGGMTPVMDVPGAKVIFKVVKREAAKQGDAEGAQAKLNEIRERIVKGEATFEDQAKTFSDCPSGARAGGDLGEFGKGAMVPEFEKAAFEQPVGEVGPIIKTAFGYHIVKVTERDDAAGKVKASHILIKVEDTPATVTVLPLLKQAPRVPTAEDLTEQLTEMRKREAAMKFFEEQRAKAGVTCTLFPELAK